MEELSERFGVPEGDLVPLLERAACCGLPPYTPDQLIELIVADGRVSARLGPQLSRPLRLSPGEGFALAAASRALLAVPGAEEARALRSAVTKLEAALGSAGGMVVSVDSPSALELAKEALGRGRQLDMVYYSAARDELTERRVEPTSLRLVAGHWYLEGYCHLAGARRHFRLDRVRELELTDEPVSKLESAAPEGAEMAPGADATSVTLEIDESDRWVVETYPVSEVRPGEDGRLVVVLPIAGVAWLERLLLRLGRTARVLAPEELSSLDEEVATRLLRLYGRQRQADGS